MTTFSPEVHSALRLHLATLHHADLGARLLEEFGSASAALAAGSGELAAVEGLTPRALEKIRSPAGEAWARREARRCRQAGVRLLVKGSPEYPPALVELPSMPVVLFSRGAGALHSPAVAGIIGTRRPTPYGRRQARRFARFVASHDGCVVSGLARGIDGVAQKSALEAGGRTVAVLGSGLERIYPPEHRELARRIADSGRGVLLSEFPCDAPPRSHHFPRRNRLLSGLSRLLLVVEAGLRSGSLITVEWALKQGRPVWAVPGRVDDPEARGTLDLLRDGAAPAVDPADLAGDLGLPAAAASTRERAAAAPGAGRPVLPGPLGEPLGRLFREADAWASDEIVSRLREPPARVRAELVRLEIDGHLERGPSGRWVRSEKGGEGGEA